MGSPQCPPLPGLCSLVATAPHPVMPLQAQGLTYPSTTSIPIFGVRGGSSVGRAPGLQPGGRGFESHPLHSTSDSMSPDRKSTRLNSSHSQISYAVFCLKKKNKLEIITKE